MRALLRALPVVVLFIISCKNEDSNPEQAHIRFKYTLAIREARLASRSESEPINQPAAVLITLKKDNVISHKNLRLSLFPLGEEFISQPLYLVLREYQLTEFIVVDADNRVLYVAPIEDSEQSEFVTAPLPLSFSAGDLKGGEVIPQVLEVFPHQSPQEYGYIDFGTSTNDPFDGLLANSLRLTLNDTLWATTYLNTVILNDPSQYLLIDGGRSDLDGIQTLKIMISNLRRPEPVTKENIEIEMNIKSTKWNSNSMHPKVASFSLVEYDSLAGTLSGVFSADIYNPDTKTKKSITRGAFYKLKIKP